MTLKKTICAIFTLVFTLLQYLRTPSCTKIINTVSRNAPITFVKRTCFALKKKSGWQQRPRENATMPSPPKVPAQSEVACSLSAVGTYLVWLWAMTWLRWKHLTVHGLQFATVYRQFLQFSKILKNTYNHTIQSRKVSHSSLQECRRGHLAWLVV